MGDLPPTRAGGGRAIPPERCAPGDRIAGRYRIVGELGGGGFGIVYLAEDERLSREVALKLLLRDVDRALFEREALALARLQHPHIVVVHDVVTHGWRAGLVLERLPGRTLADALLERPLPWERVARLGAQVASALQHAHDRGVIHGDVKPQNVLLTADGAAKLTDFGTARLIETLRTGGEFMGTPAYSAPEVLAGGKPSPAADCHSLGVMLYQAAAGRFPQGRDGTARADRRHQAALLHDLVPGVPADLGSIVHRCLQDEPASRPASAAAIAQVLTRLVGTEAGAEPLIPPELRASGHHLAVPGERRRVVVLCLERRHADAVAEEWTARRRGDLESAERDAIVQAAREFGAAIEALEAGRVRLVFGLQRRTERDVGAAVACGHRLVSLLQAIPAAAGSSRVACAVHVVPAVAEAEGGGWRLGGDGMRRLDALLAQAKDGEVACSRDAASADRTARQASRDAVVGRELELGMLLAAAERARTSGAVFAVLEGPAGIGKTRVAEELGKRLAATGFTIIAVEPRLSAREQGQILLRELLAAVDAVPEAEHARAQLDPLDRELLGAASSGDWQRTGLAGAESSERAAATLVAAGRLLRGVTAARPALLIVEDAHELLPADVQQLAGLADAARSAALLLLATTRSAQALGPGPASRTVLTLAPLAAADEALLVEHALGAPPSPALVKTIRARTEGVPLHAVEIARILRDGEQLERTQRGHAALREGAELACPTSVEGIVAARLDALDAEVRLFLQVGALQGREFDLETTAKVLAPMGVRGPVLDLLAAAQEKDLAHLTAAPRGRAGRFVHALVRDVTLMQLTAARKRELHGVVATVLRDAPHLSEAERDEALAHHLALSDDPQEAVPLLRLVAERLEKSGELRAALAPLGRIEEICRESAVLGGQATEALARRGELLGQLQDAGGALQVAEQLLAEANRSDDLRLRARARLLEGVARRAKGEGVEAITALRDAESMGQQCGDAALVNGARLRLVVPLTATGLDQEAERVLEGLEADGSLRAEERIALLQERARVFFQRGDHARSLSLLDDSLALARATGDRWRAVHSLTNTVPVLAATGRLGDARGAVAEAVVLAEAIGARATTAFLKAMGAQLAHAGGRLNEARAQALEALEMALATRSAWHAAAARLALAEIEADLGSLDSAIHAAGEVVADARAIGQKRLLTWALIVLGGVQVEVGALAAAGASGDEALALAVELLDVRRRGEALALVARARRLSGDIRGAADAWRAWDDLALPEKGPDSLLARVERAMFLRTCGRAGEAAAIASDVAARAVELNLPLVRARAALAAQRCAPSTAEDRATLQSVLRACDQAHARLLAADVAVALAGELTELRSVARQHVAAVTARLSPQAAESFASRPDRRLTADEGL